LNKLILSIFLTGLIVSSPLVKADHYLIANNKIGINSASKSEIKTIFLGRKKIWKNGITVSPCYLSPEHAQTDSFFSSIINRDHASFIRFWNKKLFSGAGSSPTIFESIDDLLEYIKRNKGSICVADHRPKKLPDYAVIIDINN
jgi:hypothetical protein